MAGSFTDGMEVEVLKMITGQATSIITTTPITPYVALTTTTPTDSAAGTEVSGNNYARISSASKWATPSAGSVANNATITFATPSGSWGTVVAMGVFDASSSGNLLAWADLAVSKTIGSGDVVTFPVGDFDVTLD